MSDQGEEGQVPATPGPEGKGELPPHPTVRESFRRGLFVRLPTEGESNEGLFEPEQDAPEQPVEDASYPDQARVEQYPEQIADPYPGWRQASDGSWEAVSPEALSYAEGHEPAASETSSEIDQSAVLASVAGGETLTHPETDTETASPLTFRQPAAETAEDASAGTEAAPLVPVTPQPLEAAAEVSAPVAAEFAPETTPPAEPVPDAVLAAEDPVAATGLYIPGDVELLEGDMPLYGEKEKVPPRFAGEGLGEPIFVEFENLPQTLVGLRRLLPKGTRLTYNFDHERAWVRSSADVDLPSFAERVEALATEGEEASA